MDKVSNQKNNEGKTSVKNEFNVGRGDVAVKGELEKMDGSFIREGWTAKKNATNVT